MDYIRKNIKHFYNFFNYIIEHLLCIILLIVILIVSGLILINLPIHTPAETESQQILILGVSLENWGIWYTAIGLIITAFWSMYQYTKSVLRKQQQGASQIAQDFANNIVERMGIISDVLMSNKNIQDMIERIDTSKLKQFTVIEMDDIIGDKKYFQEFNSIVYSEQMQKKYEEILKETYNENESERFESNFALLVENTLNKLEAICINISSQAAGSQFIYESLHQIFLSTIEVLSIKISGTNTNNVNKYYTNIISVYNMWNHQKMNDIKKLNKTKKKINKLRSKANKEIKKLLNKQTKTV